MTMKPLRIECRLSSPMAGPGIPHLDALVEQMCCSHHPDLCVPRGVPIPREAVGTIPIPLCRGTVPGFDMPIPLCSAGIASVARQDSNQHFTRSIAAEDFSDVASRVKIATTGGEHRSYRLPLRTRCIDAVVWFAKGDRRELRRELKRVHGLGKKLSQGWGRVREWIVEETDIQAWWYADSEAGTVLMRELPAGDYLPNDLVGFRPWHGGAVPPYWQADLFCEMVQPC
jgi:hypothetical protein